MNAQQKYDQELEKLRHLAAAGRDFTPDGELAWLMQLRATKQAYLTMCYEESKAKGCWQWTPNQSM